MCELYPMLRSCCGIPLRVGLLFIAVLSIVTGALINAAIKNAGVDVSSIQDVLDLKSTTTTTNTTTISTLKPTPEEGQGGQDNEPEYENEPEGEDDGGQGLRSGIEAKKQKNKTTTGWSTVEIIGEDVRTEVIHRFKDDYNLDELDEAGSGDDSTEAGEAGDDAGDASNTTTASTAPTTTKELDVYTSVMGKINRNGLNFLSIAFIALGFLLFVANFTNSAELALLYVVLLLVVCVASMGLLVSVVGECARAPERCLFKKLDWFSALMVGMFWFVYVFVWAFFAAVANGMASEIERY
ncbi:uncharacterized protein LOC134802788 [Cydia splendana]|uniref:uncharacterized protein LOC134802788 n=1 Tax=Cydia splendana TaxID=1100963 RepID=UPI0028F463D9